MRSNKGIDQTCPGGGGGGRASRGKSGHGPRENLKSKLSENAFCAF